MSALPVRRFDAVVVGGGIVGVPLALVLRLYGDRWSRHHPASI